LRIQWGSPRENPRTVEGPEVGRPVRQPGRWTSLILAWLAGIILLAILILIPLLFSVLHGIQKSTVSAGGEAVPWIGILLSFLLCIIAHEFLHASWHPDFGLSDSTLLFIGLRKLQFGVYYEGVFSRTRWLMMRLFPTFALTVLPLIAWLFFYDGLSYAWQSYLMILLITNSLGSGGDLVAALIVLLQVPASGTLHFYRGRAYWKPRKIH
jgi:hypothetical protein